MRSEELIVNFLNIFSSSSNHTGHSISTRVPQIRMASNTVASSAISGREETVIPGNQIQASRNHGKLRFLS